MSTLVFWLLKESELTPNNANVLDGRYSVFGYITQNKDCLADLKVGDVIELIQAVSGLDNLANPSYKIDTKSLCLPDKHQFLLSTRHKKFRLSHLQHQPSAIILASRISYFPNRSSTLASTFIQASRSSYFLSRSLTLSLYPSQ
ncbi:hypothetical protein LguiB_000285 [Lonicera macranthoides]